MSSINHENGSWTNKNSICAMLGNFAVWNGIWQTCGQITAWTSCHEFPRYPIIYMRLTSSSHIIICLNQFVINNWPVLFWQVL
jgi:hypothetical protein